MSDLLRVAASDLPIRWAGCGGDKHGENGAWFGPARRRPLCCRSRCNLCRRWSGGGPAGHWPRPAGAH